MKIYTKTGDSGETSLFGGKRVRKNNVRIAAYGTTDELMAYIGLLRDQDIQSNYQKLLLEIQDRLFTIGSNLAADPDKPQLKKPLILKQDIEILESEIDEMEKHLQPMKNFILPGGHPTVSFCHVARCVCRRAERLVVELTEDNTNLELEVIYLNRLSDFLFVLSRKLCKDLNAEERPWNPRL
jgi:cob(I)alamin adenosyltransferase